MKILFFCVFIIQNAISEMSLSKTKGVSLFSPQKHNVYKVGYFMLQNTKCKTRFGDVMEMTILWEFSRHLMKTKTELSRGLCIDTVVNCY